MPLSIVYSVHFETVLSLYIMFYVYIILYILSMFYILNVL
jgi:hypothetical protein